MDVQDNPQFDSILQVSQGNNFGNTQSKTPSKLNSLPQLCAVPRNISLKQELPKLNTKNKRKFFDASPKLSMQWMTLKQEEKMEIPTKRTIRKTRNERGTFFI